MERSETHFRQTEDGCSGFGAVISCLHVALADRPGSPFPLRMIQQPLLAGLVPEPCIGGASINRHTIRASVYQRLDGNETGLLVDSARDREAFWVKRPWVRNC